MKKTKIPSICAILVLCGLASLMVSAEVGTGRIFGKNNAFTIEELPAGKLKSQLQTLPAPAREKAMNWLHTLTFESFDAAEHLRVDPDGGIYIVCPDCHGTCDGKSHHSHGSAVVPDAANAPLAPSDDLEGNEADATVTPETGRVSVPVSSPPIYHSKPGAPYHIYLDFNGGIVAGKAWNTSRGIPSWDCLPWGMDTDTKTFSDLEQAEMRRVWERISEDYAPFDINVTTDVAFDPEKYTGDKNKVGWLLFTPTKDKNNNACPHNGSGGVAYVGVFGLPSYFSTYQPAWVTPSSSANMSEAGSHEMGHNFGLSHDGTSSEEYYGGHDATAFAPSWGPLMGTGYGRDVSQWSKGEYFGANETENDLATISAKVPYRTDDHGDSRAQATVWTGEINQNGIIEKTGNADYFEFATGAGTISFKATTYRCDAATWGGNLDILLELYDEFGTLLAFNNPAAETNATFARSVQAGTYYLVVKPTGAGTPEQGFPSGYKQYGSLGQYNITGNIVPTNNVVLTEPNGGELWAGGETRAITWLSALGGNVKIELLKNGSLDSTVIASTPNDGSYDWSIPPSQTAAADYRIQISSVETPDKKDTSSSDFTISPIPLAEISVEQPVGTSLVDGVSTVSFEDSFIGTPVSLPITIRNTGTADLTDLVVSKSGVDAADFVVSDLSVTTLSPGAETTFTVLFTPSVMGERNASLQISSNDADENPFDLSLKGVGLVPPTPDIALEQPVGNGLTNGASTVDFGNSNIGKPTTLTFTIRNEGDAGLAGMTLSKTGANMADFVLVKLSSTTLAPTGTLTFTVTFTPSASGTRAATLRIISNDPDENPFEIALVGTGVIPFVPGIVIEETAGKALENGKPMKGFGFVDLGKAESRTFTIRNNGIANLTDLTATTSGSHFPDFMLGTFGATTLAPGEETTLIVTFAPAKSGSRYAMLHIGSNDPDNNPFHIELTGSGVVPQVPEISVEYPLQTILVDGSATVAFGNVNIGTPIIKTVTVANAGTADLTNLAVSLSGENAADFDLGALGATTLASGASTTFTVTFKSLTAGARSANIQIASNDVDENPFDIVLGATSVVPPVPEIQVEHPTGTGLVDGVSSLVFGAPSIGTPVTKNVTIRNAGTANLTGLAVARSGTDASNFTVGSLESISLNPNGVASFTVTFTPSAARDYSAILLISSNDADENPFEVILVGAGAVPPAPEIVVEHPAGTNLVDGTSELIFGNSTIGTSVAKTVTVRNTGSANLTGLAVTYSGTHDSDFATGSLPVTTLVPGASAAFTVIFTPSVSGLRSASLRIASNDANENPFDVTLRGTGVLPPAPEIVVEHPAGNNLVDGTANLAFGNSNIGTPIAKTVTIRNTGTADLTGLAVTRSGANAADFATSALESATLAPDASMTFTVTFTPSASGTRSAALRIASNDANENPFDIILGGTGVVPPASEIVVQQGEGSNKNLTDNESSRDFGEIQVGTTSKAMVFTIKNTGNVPLTRVDVVLRGKHAKDFKVVKTPAKSIAPGSSTQFKVVYNPGAARVSSATLQIASNDADENPFRVKLTGKGAK